ncbi:MAG: cache domain-containing protein [Desulfobacterales bacterium]|jgi:PAS domain S-box-containing protein|nr:cache domain-containing protein [Desulfobacterales bacterium]
MGTKTSKLTINRLLFSILAGAATSVVVLTGSIFIAREYFVFQNEKKRFHEEYIQNSRQILKNETERTLNFINHNWAKTENRLKDDIRDRVYEAHAIATHLYNEHAGKISEADLKKIILEALRSIRFNNGRGYYFVTELTGIEMLFTDRPELEGKQLIDMQDPRGAFVVRDMIDIVNKYGEGFYQYQWTKPNAVGIDFPKIAYIKHFAPFNGFIGTGEYLDDVARDIQQEVLERIAKIRFGDTGCIFVVNGDGTVLVNNSHPELAGKNAWDMEDVNGLRIVQEWRAASEKSDGDFITYFRTQPSTGLPAPKISYVKQFPEWNWIVGADIYADAVQSVMESKKSALWRETKTDIFLFTSVLAVFLLCMLLLSSIVSRYLKNGFDVFISFFKSMETGGSPIDTESLSLHELKMLAGSANTMLAVRKEAEETLSESEEKHQEKLMSIFHAAPVGIGVVVNRIIQQANERLCEMTGYAESEMINKSSRMLYPTDDDFEFVGKEKYRQINEKGIGTVETRWRRKDGTVFNVLLSSAPINPNDMQQGTTFTALDITERILAEGMIRMRLKLMEVAATKGLGELLQKTLDEVEQFTSSQIGFYHFVEADQKTLSLQAWSTRTLRDFCRARGEGLHYSIEKAGVWVDCVHEKKPVIHNDYASLAHRKGMPDGHAQIVRELIVPVFRNNRVVAILGVGNKQTDYTPKDIEIVSYLADIAWEITERKRTEEDRVRLEQQLMQVQKLESVGLLAGGVAHDINNMMSVVIGYSEMALRHLEASDPVHKNIKEALEAAKRSTAMVRQLLAFARKQTLEIKPLDLNAVILEFLKMLRLTLRENIHVETRLAPSLSLIDGDTGQIEQVIMNLAINAQDAMSDGGELVIETTDILFNHTRSALPEGIAPGQYVMLAVHDTGCGMDQETVDKIFDPFFTTKEVGKGTGLGLSTSYGIILQHGGSIKVESEPGKGTVVRIYFPRRNEVIKEIEAQKPVVFQLQQRGTETVLLVEDSDAVREISREILKDCGYKVLEADSGKTAIEIFKTFSDSIELLVTDVIMPEMNGKALYDKLKALNPSLKVLYISGYTADIIDRHGVREENFNFIQKPFTIHGFTSKVREALDGNKKTI